MNNNFPRYLYHGSGIEITDGYIRANKGYINAMQTPITAVFASSDLVHAKVYAIMRLVGTGRLAPRKRESVYVQKINIAIPPKAYVYETDSNGFQRDIDGSYYCLTDKPIKDIIEVDIIQELLSDTLKVYVLKDKFNTPNMSDETWKKLLQDENNFELYKPNT